MPGSNSQTFLFFFIFSFETLLTGKGLAIAHKGCQLADVGMLPAQLFSAFCF